MASLRPEWARLKSGTDVRGVALAGYGEEVTLTGENAARIAAAFGRRVRSGAGTATPLISVSRDSRLSGPALERAVIDALAAVGCRVLACGLSTTPAAFMTIVDRGCDGAVQITASHHPAQRNGLKFFLPGGGLEGTDISALLADAQDTPVRPGVVPGTVTVEPYLKAYAARLRSMIINGCGEGALPLAGFRIVVDAGNGAGGFYASDVLAPLGADVSGSQFLEPDGTFPNHIPNPEDPFAMSSVCAAVEAVKADLGVIFDTDADRAGLVGADGREINRNRLIALTAAAVLEQSPGGAVVTDSVTSDGLKQFIEQTLGGRHIRYKRGYKEVINEALRLNAAGVDTPLAIETSGHAALRENYFLDDGAYLVTRLIIKAAALRRAGRTLSALIEALPEPAQAAELRAKVLVPDYKAYGAAVLVRLEAYAAARKWPVADDSAEGVRIAFAPGEWALLRLSVHDPVMPLNIESGHTGGCAGILSMLMPFFEAQPGLDIAAMTAYAAAGGML